MDPVGIRACNRQGADASHRKGEHVKDLIVPRRSKQEQYTFIKSNDKWMVLSISDTGKRICGKEIP
jgi:hypothetical protein